MQKGKALRTLAGYAFLLSRGVRTEPVIASHGDSGVPCRGWNAAYLLSFPAFNSFHGVSLRAIRPDVVPGNGPVGCYLRVEQTGIPGVPIGRQGKGDQTMTRSTYKGYTIQTVGISRSIYRPGQIPEQVLMSPGFAMSTAGAKRWIREDIRTNGTTGQTASPERTGRREGGYRNV